MADFGEIPPMQAEQSDHLTAGEIAAFLDGYVNGTRQARIEAHLDVCQSCRTELAAVVALIDSAPAVRKRWSRGRIVLGVALAAGLATLVVTRRDLLPTGGRHEPVRAPDFGEGRARLEVISPGPNSIVSREGLTLSWRGSRADLYRVTLLTLGGEPVWTADTPDTAIAVPDSVRLVAGSTYFWRADGIAAGLAASTGAQRLRVQP